MDCRFLSFSSLNVLALTWNVNAKFESEMDTLGSLFTTYNLSLTPDIVIVSLQEIIELSTSKVIGGTLNIGQTKEGISWEESVLLALNSLPNFSDTNMYITLTTIQMVGLWIAVFVVQELEERISQVQTASFARGIGGVLGNKGAVYVRMHIDDTSICIINSHFAAHQKQVLLRNRDYYAILHQKVFTDSPMNFNNKSIKQLVGATPKQMDLAQTIKDIHKVINEFENSNSIEHNGHDLVVQDNNMMGEDNKELIPVLSANDHDIIIWMGDLNYRISDEIPLSTVYNYIKTNNLTELASYDQLTQQMETGAAFENFKEGLLTFNPTYQYIPGTDFYDDRVDKKLRYPAWCDRILWRVGKYRAKANNYSISQSLNSILQDLGLSDASSHVDSTLTSDEKRDHSVHPSHHGHDDQLSTAKLGNIHETDTLKLNYDSALNASKTEGHQHNHFLSVKGISNSESEHPDEEMLTARYGDDLVGGVQLLEYDRCINTISDHKPVRAILSVSVRKIDQAAHEEHLIEYYTKHQINRRPFSRKSSQITCGVHPVTISPKSFHFYFNTREVLTVRLKNRLTANAIQISIVRTSIPQWLDVSYESSVVIPPNEFADIPLLVDYSMLNVMLVEEMESLNPQPKRHMSILRSNLDQSYKPSTHHSTKIDPSLNSTQSAFALPSLKEYYVSDNCKHSISKDRTMDTSALIIFQPSIILNSNTKSDDIEPAINIEQNPSFESNKEIQGDDNASEDDKSEVLYYLNHEDETDISSAFYYGHKGTEMEPIFLPILCSFGNLS